MDTNKFPLYVYVIAVAIVWVILLVLSWFAVISIPFNQLLIGCAGFAVGMLAMYIAVHVYRWR